MADPSSSCSFRSRAVSSVIRDRIEESWVSAAIKGSAWVDETAREVLSMGFSFSKNPMFVDHVEVSVVFGLPTPLGRGPSKVSFDGKGGFLFIHKHMRGSGVLSDPKVVL